MIINELKDHTYCARLRVRQGDQLIEIDSRSSNGHNLNHRLRTLPSPSLAHRTLALPKERRKFVTFTVELHRDGGPLGLTLASEGDDASAPGRSLYVSALVEGGLAQRTRTVQVRGERLRA